MRYLFPILLFLGSTSLRAQSFTYPDSAAVIQNHVKVARIYFMSNDGKKHPQKELYYDNAGRIIRDANSSNSFYYVYEYDAKGRRISSIQRSAKGEFIQKFTEEFDAQTGNRTTRLTTSYDTLHPSHVYVFDTKNRKIQEEQYNGTTLQFIYRMTYGEKDEVVASYDSSGSAQTASWKEHGKIMKKRTYDPHGNFLHEFKYTYDYYGRLWKMTDSAEAGKPVTYENVYSKEGGPREGISRNGKMMSESESLNFQKEHREFYISGYKDFEQEYGLPVPEMVNEHKLERDRNGNIIKDILTQKQGSSSHSFEYVYEYEFY